jgi:hypothetical protein
MGSWPPDVPWRCELAAGQEYKNERAALNAFASVPDAADAEVQKPVDKSATDGRSRAPERSRFTVKLRQTTPRPASSRGAGRRRARSRALGEPDGQKVWGCHNAPARGREAAAGYSSFKPATLCGFGC